MFNGPIRGGTRGGQGEFKWSDVSADKDRENYLGHSINAPTGRWQKNKDVHWYNRDKKTAEEEAADRREEIRKIKEAEEDALAVALGFKPAVRGPQTGANAEPVAGAPPAPVDPTPAAAPAPDIDTKALEKEERRKRKEEKRRRKEEKRARKEARRLARSDDYSPSPSRSASPPPVRHVERRRSFSPVAVRSPPPPRYAGRYDTDDERRYPRRSPSPVRREAYGERVRAREDWTPPRAERPRVVERDVDPRAARERVGERDEGAYRGRGYERDRGEVYVREREMQSVDEDMRRRPEMAWRR